MATIIDPDDLKLSTQPASGTPNGSVYIDPTATPPIIELISTDQYSGTGSFSPADGVSVQALYSFLKEQWKSNATFIKYPFPMEAITSEQFEFINNWEPRDTTTSSRKYLRFGGWSEKNAVGAVKRQYMGVVTLGSIGASQRAYYSWYNTASPAGFVTAATDFTYDGPVNESVKIYESVSSPAFDYRTIDFTLNVYIRPSTTGSSGSVVGYTYNQSDTKAIGASTVTYQVYRFPLSTAVDLNLTLTDSEITSFISSKSMSITWYASNQASNTFLPFDLNGGPYNFRVIINADGTATTSQIYNFVQYLLRQNSDIDAGSPGTQTGKLTAALVTFVGSTLETFDILPLDATNGGVAIDGFDTNFTNNIKMRDNSNTLRSFPITAAGKITFNTNLIEDAAAKYWMFYTAAFGTGSAALVQNKSAANITGDLHYVVNTSGTSNGSGVAGGFTMTVAGASFPTGSPSLADKVLYVSSGLNAGYYWIASNTGTVLTLETAFENTDAAMSWEIRNKNTLGEISWDFDYTGGGSTDKPVTVVAIGLGSAQYVSAPFTIGSTTGQSFPLTAALERNYSDPV
jgi:hypothetical protein